ncbi:hypothetical protein ACFWUZ_26855 [Streptomyces sp. NPDC058646]|uniref:hypothetical protein n=1 Tax=Streptomyces sp. NPDC058646 TaxID=3346574 RepID=UPI00364B1C52
MPSVTGLLEEREHAARQRVEVLQAELQEAEAAWERFVMARQTVPEVLAEPPVGEEASLAGVAGERPARVAGAVPGSVVPAWREGLALDSLAPDYQRLVEVLAGSGEEMDCRQLAATLGLEVVAAKVEGGRSKVKRRAGHVRGGPRTPVRPVPGVLEPVSEAITRQGAELDGNVTETENCGTGGLLLLDWIRHPRAVRETPLPCPADQEITRPSRQTRTHDHQDR